MSQFEWRLIERAPNPWGAVPVTGGGQSLTGRARAYMDELMAAQRLPDTTSRRHHYVPKAYLREWSFDERRIWCLDTISHEVKALGLADVCVKENFYRVTGPDGTDHNRVELLFGIVDRELRRVQKLFAGLEDPSALEFDDLVGLSVSMAVQRMRTLQQRRLLVQLNRYWNAQNAEQNPLIDHSNRTRELAGHHTELIVRSMWDSADALTTRGIEIWHDSEGRFMTCDAPVLVPFLRNVRRGLLDAPYVLWPVSPYRVVAMALHPHGMKAVIHPASGKHVGTVRDAI